MFQFLRDKQVADDPKLNWDHLRLLLRRHKLLPVSEAMLEYLPEDQKSQWKNDLQFWAVRSMLLFNELTSFYYDLAIQNINPIMIKGPVLAWQLYGKFSGRFFIYLDLVVPKEEIPVAIKTFLSMGYALENTKINLDSEDFRQYFSARNYIGLYHPEKRVSVELHVGIYALGWMKSEDEHILNRELISVDINGIKLLTFNNESNFLYLCYHGAKHMYFRLSWLRDVAGILAKWQIKHSSVLKMATDLKIEKLLGISLLLAKEFFDTPIPSDYNSLKLDSLYYRNAVQININIIKGPSGIIPFSNFSTKYSKEKVKGVSKFSVNHIFLILIYKVFFRKGFLIRLKHYLLTNSKDDK